MLTSHIAIIGAIQRSDDDSHAAATRKFNAARQPWERVDCAGRSYAALRDEFRDHGYCLFTSCSLRNFLDIAATHTRWQSPRRQLGVMRDSKVGATVARDADTLSLLHFIHGRPPLPFQSLQFYNGTQRRTHSDVVHFDTLPTRGNMAAAWLALEDVDETAGPLHYYPGSHREGLWDFLHLGLEQQWLNATDDFSRRDPQCAFAGLDHDQWSRLPAINFAYFASRTSLC